MANPMTGEVLGHCALATLEQAAGQSRYGFVADAAIAIAHGRIRWRGGAGDLPGEYAKWPARDLGGRLVTPALIDCHTHVVHAGNRALEFEMRQQGATYAEIARGGGGIVSTVRATRAATEAELLAQALPRIDAMIAEGVATIEIKSGYGLDGATELRMLRVARQLGAMRAIRVATSFLGAHAVPAEFAGRADAYLDEVCIPALEAAHGDRLVDAVDGFCEGIAFSPAQIEKLFGVAVSLGLPVKLHAEQLSNLGGAALAARFGAMSADHLEYMDETGAMAMAKAGTVAVLLPGAYYALRERQAPPVELLRKHGVAMAVATDCNPGSSPMTSLPLAMNMACTYFGLTAEEALAGATRNAALALRLADRGAIAPGLRADLAIWNAGHPRELAARIGVNVLHERIFSGGA
jgi:imidazolonepropionase